MHIERDNTPQQEDGKQPCTPVSRFTPLIIRGKGASDASQRQQQQQQPKPVKRKSIGEEVIIVAAEKKAKREAVKAAAKYAKVHIVEDGPTPAAVASGGGPKGASQNGIAAKAHEARSSSSGLLGLLDGLDSKSSSLLIKPAPSSAKPASLEGHGRKNPARGLTRTADSYAVPTSTDAHGATSSSGLVAAAAAVAEGSGSSSRKKEVALAPGAHTSGYPGLATSTPPTIEDARFQLRVVRGILTTFNEIDDKATTQGVSFIEAAPCEEWLEINVAYLEEVLKRFGGEVAERNEVFKHLAVVAELALQALRGVREGEG